MAACSCRLRRCALCEAVQRLPGATHDAAGRPTVGAAERACGSSCRRVVKRAPERVKRGREKGDVSLSEEKDVGQREARLGSRPSSARAARITRAPRTHHAAASAPQRISCLFPRLACQSQSNTLLLARLARPQHQKRGQRGSLVPPASGRGGGGDTEHTNVLKIQAHPFFSACAAACLAWPCSAQLRRRENVFDEKHARCDRLQRRVSRKAVLAAPIGQVNRMPRRTCRPEWAPCTLRPFSSLAVGLRLPEWQLTQQRGCG